jgi:hypothetical protein
MGWYGSGGGLYNVIPGSAAIPGQPPPPPFKFNAFEFNAFEFEAIQIATMPPKPC